LFPGDKEEVKEDGVGTIGRQIALSARHFDGVENPNDGRESNLGKTKEGIEYNLIGIGPYSLYPA
jgi:hypothetical protein